LTGHRRHRVPDEPAVPQRLGSAARAGGKGRGFAVVADEVPTLAPRAAVAAKEFRDLIEVSANEVERGSALVGSAVATMQDIVIQTDMSSELDMRAEQRKRDL